VPGLGTTLATSGTDPPCRCEINRDRIGHDDEVLGCQPTPTSSAEAISSAEERYGRNEQCC